MPGASAAPIASCAMVERAHERSHYRSVETPTFPAQRFTAYLRALPGVHDLVVTVVCGSPPAHLTPAQGCQDHTTLPSERDVARLTTSPSSIASRRTFRDDAHTPLLPRRDARIWPLIWVFVNMISVNRNVGSATDWHDGQFAHGCHPTKPASAAALSRLRQRPRKTELVPIRVCQVEIALAPFGVAGRGRWLMSGCQRLRESCIDVPDIEDDAAPP